MNRKQRWTSALCTLLCVSLLLVSMPCMTASAAQVGDIDGNAQIDMNDSFRLYLYASGQIRLTQDALLRADYNGDGRVDMMDSFALYLRVSGRTGAGIVVRDGVTDESVYMKNIRLYNSATGKTYTAGSRSQLQETVAELVRYELGADKFGEKSDEAWKAMAIAAYTVLARHCYYGATYEIWMAEDLDLSRKTDKRIYDAVGSVLGVKLAYNDASMSAYDQLCQVFYSSSSAGVSCTSLNAWGYVQLPYLQSVESPYDTDEWIAYYSLGTDTLTATFQITVDDLIDCVSRYMEETIYCEKRDGEYSFFATQADGPYWARSNLYYYRSNGEKRYVTGLDVRNSINIYGVPHVRSHAYTVLSETNGLLTIQTKGYGHGVGMSGYGMIGYANDAGWTHQQILAHYFSITADTPYGLVGPKW
ncbi:MAG: dockerin type I domain-containing protein [Acutalibacteraceae bacterium]